MIVYKTKILQSANDLCESLIKIKLQIWQSLMHQLVFKKEPKDQNDKVLAE